MKLSFYLFRDTIRTLDEAIQSSDLDGFGQPVPALPSLPFKAKAFVRVRTFQEVPESIQFISTGFQLETASYKRATVSCIVFIEVENRVFALPFNARSVLSYEHLEPGFGLKVVANSIAAKQLKSIDSKKIDNNVIQRKTQLSKNSGLDDFEIDTSANWIQAVAGKTSDSAFGGIADTPQGKPRKKTLQGRDALAFTYSKGFSELGTQCEFLLNKFSEETYKEHFKFIDEIKFLSPKDPLVPKLAAKLRETLESATTDRIHVVYPDLSEGEVADKFRISYGHKAEHVDYLSISQVLQFADTLENPDLENIRISACDTENNTIGLKYALNDLLIAEIDFEGGTYVFSNNSWCGINSDYLTELNREVAAIQDISGTLSLPAIKKKQATASRDKKYEKEGEYNIRAAAHIDAISLDKQNFQVIGNQKVEISDILTKDNHYVCVKKMNDSATLSHLFSQASVSSRLLQIAPKYKQAVIAHGKRKWRDFELLERPTFVYAIPTEKSGTLAQTLFFFSKVTLLIHAKDIISHGHNVALYKIDVESVDTL